VLSPKAFSLGVEPQTYLTYSGSNILFLHGGVGLGGGVDLGIQYGIPFGNYGGDRYFGAAAEFSLLRDSKQSPALSLEVGAHALNRTSYFLDSTLMISKVVRKAEPYLALDANISLPPATLKPEWRAVGGIGYRLTHVTELMLELGLGLDHYSSYLSAGLNLYF
jgi:hypothetical protein